MAARTSRPKPPKIRVPIRRVSGSLRSINIKRLTSIETIIDAPSEKKTLSSIVSSIYLKRNRVVGKPKKTIAGGSRLRSTIIVLTTDTSSAKEQE
jgi:hypothetical protein